MKLPVVILATLIAFSYGRKRSVYDFINFERAFCQHGFDGHGLYGKPDGHYAHPKYCEKMISCEHFEHHSKAAKVTVQTCPFGLFFNPIFGVCDWPRNVDCYIYQGKTCFGSKSNQYGRVRATQNGYLKGIKLVHLNGHISCQVKQPGYESFWGCNSEVTGFKYFVNTWVTTRKNKDGIIFPVPGTQHDEYGNYYIEEYNQLSPYIKMQADPYNPVSVKRGDELRIWYGEDLFDIHEASNGGRHCIEVYALYSFFHPFSYLNKRF